MLPLAPRAQLETSIRTIAHARTFPLLQRQFEAYGSDPDYRAYLQQTPRLFFFIPPPEAQSEGAAPPAALDPPPTPTPTPSAAPPPEVAVSDALSEEEIADIMNAGYPEPE